MLAPVVQAAVARADGTGAAEGMAVSGGIELGSNRGGFLWRTNTMEMKGEGTGYQGDGKYEENTGIGGMVLL